VDRLPPLQEPYNSVGICRWRGIDDSGVPAVSDTTGAAPEALDAIRGRGSEGHSLDVVEGHLQRRETAGVAQSIGGAVFIGPVPHRRLHLDATFTMDSAPLLLHRTRFAGTFGFGQICDYR